MAVIPKLHVTRVLAGCMSLLLSADVCLADGGYLSDNTWKRQSSLDNYIDTVNYQSDSNVRNLLECGLKCLEDSDCDSFFYVQDSNLCRLMDTVKQSTANLTLNVGTRYYTDSEYTTTTSTTSTTTTTTTTTPTTPSLTTTPTTTTEPATTATPTMTNFQTSGSVCSPNDDDFHTVNMSDGTPVMYRRNAVSLSTAEQTCTDLGARIFRPIGTVRNNFLESLATTCPGYSRDYWLDGKTDSGFDSWTTMDDSVVYSELNWEPSQPDRFYTACCLISRSTGKWNDVACSTTAAYVLCEIDDQPSVCPPNDDDFHTITLSDGTTLTFRAFLTGAVDLTPAQQTCSDVGAKMFQPIATAKNSFLQSLVTTCPGYGRQFWLDGKTDAAFDSWTTMDDLIAFDEFNWASSQPDQFYVASCLRSTYTGEWNDVPCSNTAYVLCEISE